MKKIVIILVTLTFLVSCGNKENENETNSGTTNIEVNSWTIIDEKSETGSIDNEWVENANSGTENTDNTINSSGTTNIWTVNNNSGVINNNPETINKDTKAPSTKVNSDEAALEAEVNDLLDEFINSLDNYEK